MSSEVGSSANQSAGSSLLTVSQTDSSTTSCPSCSFLKCSFQAAFPNWVRRRALGCYRFHQRVLNTQLFMYLIDPSDVAYVNYPLYAVHPLGLSIHPHFHLSLLSLRRLATRLLSVTALWYACSLSLLLGIGSARKLQDLPTSGVTYLYDGLTIQLCSISSPCDNFPVNPTLPASEQLFAFLP